MCKYCDNPDRDSAEWAYEVNSRKDVLIYRDDYQYNGAWVMHIEDDSAGDNVDVCISNCPWCGDTLN